jgi:hypothetical protein
VVGVGNRTQMHLIRGTGKSPAVTGSEYNESGRGRAGFASWGGDLQLRKVVPRRADGEVNRSETRAKLEFARKSTGISGDFARMSAFIALKQEYLQR